MNNEPNILPPDPSLLQVTTDNSATGVSVPAEPSAGTEDQPIVDGVDVPPKEEPSVTKTIATTVTIAKDKTQKPVIMLPNGMVGKPYDVVLDVAAGGDPIESLSITGADNVGLAFDPTTLGLGGVPSQPGEHALTLRYVVLEMEKCPHCQREIGKHFQTLPPRRKEKVVTLRLIVNADPRSLWKDLLSDGSALYAKPDSAIASLVAGGKEVVAASQRGRSHAHVGSFRDDAFRIDYDPDTKTSFIIVADGAGSAKYSRKGSEIACDTVLQQLRAKMTAGFWGKLPASVAVYRGASDTEVEIRKRIRSMLYDSLGSAVFAAKNAILDESRTQKDTTIKDYATTLLVATCKRLEDGWFVSAYWVGDGGIGIYRKGEEVLLLGEPDGGEFAGQTRFLTMPEVLSSGEEVLRRIRFEVVEDFTALVVMTDGVTDPEFQTDNNLKRREKWDELWNKLQPVLDGCCSGDDAAQRLLQWLDFWSPGNHDDRTIAVML